MKDYQLIQPDDLAWRPSNLMCVPNADFLERTGTQKFGARLWRLPPKSANTLHRHVRSEEFYFVIEGTGRIRVGDVSLTVQRHGGIWVRPEMVRQIFNDSEQETLWLIVSAPEEELTPGMDMSVFYPTDPRALPSELSGATWPPKQPGG